jgi:ribosomal protein S18 acetylase RimI-like enzyme
MIFTTEEVENIQFRFALADFKLVDLDKIRYVDADDDLKERIAKEWGEKKARHMHISDGFSIVAMYQENPIGLISVYWKKLPPPLVEKFEGYIDIIEVLEGFRRKRIAKKLVDISLERSRKMGYYQVRAWSSEDKTEAIPMWQALGFGLCPATLYPKGEKVKGYYATKVL